MGGATSVMTVIKDTFS